MKKTIFQSLIIVVSLVIGYNLGRSNIKENVVAGFVYKGQSSTMSSDIESRDEKSDLDAATTKIMNGKVLENGAIPDAKTAYEMAYPILCAIYGEDAIRKELPLEVYLVDNNKWILNGSWNYGLRAKGGVATISINKCDGRVLKVVHSK